MKPGLRDAVERLYDLQNVTIRESEFAWWFYEDIPLKAAVRLDVGLGDIAGVWVIDVIADVRDNANLWEKRCTVGAFVAIDAAPISA